MTTLRVLLAGGGTAGHVNPLLATAHALRELPGGAEVAALGTEAGLEARLVPAAGLPLHVVPRVPLPRRPSPDLLRLPANLWRAVSAADRALRETRADVVVGFGGYVATPAYLAARRRGVPVVVHEQNALPGIANKVGARLAAAVALTFGSTPLRAARGHTVTTGLPLRAPIAALAARRAAGADERAAARAAAAAELGLDPSPVTVLVTGGSLGAQRLNETLAAASAELLATGAQVLHLTGNGKDAPVRAALASPDGAAAQGAERYHVAEYQDRMELAYAAADLVVCRSGAGTVAEVAALGLPALFVPLPIGNGEQARNAADVVAAGGALLIDDDAFTPEALRNHLLPLLADRDTLADMGARAAGTGPADGAARLARLVAGVARGTGSDGADDAAGPDDAPGETR